MKQFDPALLEPVHDGDDDRVTVGTVVALVALGLVILIGTFGAVWLVRGNEPTTVTLVAPDVDGIAPLDMSEFVVADPIVFWPTIAPSGWEVCRQVPDPAGGDLLCSADETRWARFALHRSVVLEGRPPGPLPLSTLIIDGDQRILSIPINENDGPFLSVTSNGVATADLVKMAASVPLIGNAESFAPIDEPTLDDASLSPEELGALLPDERTPPRVVVDRRSFNVFGESLTLTAGLSSVNPARPRTILDHFWTIDSPRKLPTDRTVIVGKDGSHAVALWDQGGYHWRLNGLVSETEMTTLATTVIDAIGRVLRDQ